MPRPIDADRLYNEIISMKISVGGKQIFHPTVKQSVLDSIEMSDTLDYAPVRHGEWIDEIEPNAVTASGREVHVFRCSSCDFTWANKTAVLHYFKYCPNCGARMDAKEDADDQMQQMP